MKRREEFEIGEINNKITVTRAGFATGDSVVLTAYRSNLWDSSSVMIFLDDKQVLELIEALQKVIANGTGT